MKGRSLKAGLRAASHVKLVLLLAGVTALLGIAAATPLRPALQRALGETLAGEHFLRDAPDFAPSDFVDFMHQARPAISGAFAAARLAALLGVAFQAFFVGGLVVVLGRGAFGFGDFFGPCRRNLGHNLKCLFVFALLLLAVFGTLLPASEAAADALFGDAPPDSSGRALFGWARAAVFLVLFGALSLLYDFARAVRRYLPGAGALRGYRFALRALRGSWPAATALFLFWLVAGAVAVGAGFALTAALPAVSAGAIALLFVVQFAVLALRSAVRVAAWGSYLAFLDTRAREAVAATTRIRYRDARSPAPAISFSD